MGHASREHSLPAVHALHLAELVKRWGVSAEELFEGTDAASLDLADPAARISIPTSIAIVERARALTGEGGLGFYLGLQMRVSAHGYLGFAAMTSATVREALDLATRFAPTRTTALSLRVVVAGDAASLIIDEHADFGPARDVWISAILVGLWQIGNALTGRELTGSAELAYPEPSYFAHLRRLLPDVRFDQPKTRLLFDAGVLDLPLTMADPAAQALAREQCERALALASSGIVERTRELVARREGGFRTATEVAAELHVSARTLKRQLAAQGVAYSTLLGEQQRDKALLLLRTTNHPVERVAEELGYSDVANFTRAFRRWTGMTPSAYRRRR